MATFREAVYMVIDLLKQVSDDSYYTEEHILFLLSKIRPLILTKKYRNSRNQSYLTVDRANYQEIYFELEEDTNDGPGKWYINSDSIQVPRLLPVGYPKAFTVRNLQNEVVSVVSPERFSFLGYNKWLKNNIYCSISNERKFFVRQMDSEGRVLPGMRLFAIFEDALESTPIATESYDIDNILDMRFPLEDQLLPQCIELVVQEITGSKYSPEDRANNAKDDLSDASVKKSYPTPATNTVDPNE